MNKLCVLSACFGVVFFLAACSEEAPVQSKYQLNDTGITWGGNYPKDINDSCVATINADQLADGDAVEGDILTAQDCMYGPDKNVSDGQAHSFRYRKISDDGELLNAKAQTWACVLDETTGLLWEVKQESDGEYGNAGSSDADDKYTWYNSTVNANGGAIGDWNRKFAHCAGYVDGKPMTYCNTEQLASRVSEQSLCGFSDWRIPSKPELESLVNFGRTMPAIDLQYFPNTQNNFYWTQTPVVANQATAWAVSFQFGYSAQMPRSNTYSLRLVRNWWPQAQEVDSDE